MYPAVEVLAKYGETEAYSCETFYETRALDTPGLARSSDAG